MLLCPTKTGRGLYRAVAVAEPPTNCVTRVAPSHACERLPSDDVAAAVAAVAEDDQAVAAA